jgi:nickel-dependent lactate racemase
MKYQSFTFPGSTDSINIPGESFLGCVGVQEKPALKNPEEACFRALQSPSGSDRLRDLAKGKETVTILVSDYTRAIPANQLLPPVVDELINAGIKESSINIIIACGTHRPSSPGEIVNIIGEEWVERLSVANHDSQDKSTLKFMGETSRHTPVWINKFVIQSDLRIALGQIEIHEFAGFSGGAKSILPGVSGEETVKANHSPGMIGHEKAGPGIIKGNPVRDDMEEAATMVGLDFIVNVTRTMDQHINGVFAGDIQEAHRQGVNFLKSYSTVELLTKPDVIVTSPGKALSVDFYQSLKPVIALGEIASHETVLLLVADCPDRLGSMGDVMIQAFEGASKPQEVIQKLNTIYKPQMDHALLLSRLLEKGVRVVAVSANVSPNVLSKMLLIPAESAQEGLDIALKLSGKENPLVLIFPQAERTLPVLK